MSLCCFPSFRGSGQKKAQSEICACGRKNPNKPHRRLPSASGPRTRRVTVGIPGKEYPSQAIKWVRAGKAHSSSSSSSQNSSHDIVVEQVDRFTVASNGYSGQLNQTRKSVHCQTETFMEDITEVVAHGPGHTTYQVRVHLTQAEDTVQYLSENSNRDITEELVKGFNYSTSLDQGKVHQATDTIQGRTQYAPELTLTRREAHRMRALQKGTLEKVAASLVPAFPAGSIPHICSLMPTHPAFSRAQWFLDELLTRSCPPSIRSDGIKVFSASGGIRHNDRGDTPQEQLAKATASVMGTWPDRVQYLGQPLLSPWFILKQALVLHKLPAPHPVGLVRSLWVELAHLEPTQAQWEEPAPELKPSPEPEEGPAPGLEPGLAVVVLEPSAPPAVTRIPTAEPALSPTTDYPRAVNPKHLLREEKLNILTFPPRLVAKQLTAMDAELFKKVLPHQCLGSVWSQRTKPGNGHVASTVSATVRQFNYVATCVITTCLGDPSMMAQDRAKVVEHWIKVAKECRSLRNFSSLQAILAGLQSVSIHRLRNMWQKVSRRWAFTLKKLCKENNTRSREQLIKPSRYASLMCFLRGSKKGTQKKCVPFLGKYLKHLNMMDTMMADDLEVQRILEEIVILQEAAEEYNIEPEAKFQAWFWALERLSENESYIRSCQVEPQSKAVVE